MTTAATSLLGLALPVTGELSGTWGDTVNNSITSLLDTAVAGTTTLSTDGDVTLSTTTLAANQARQAIILWTANGTTTRNITAPAQSKIYTVINASAGTQSIVLRGAGPTTGVTIIKGESAVCAWNGSDFIKISNTGGSASFTNVTVSGTTTLSGLTASTALALNSSKEVISVTNTGTGNNVLSASPTLTGTISAAALTLSSDLTLSGGTANGVLYLNGSKVATSGSALTFDGTNFATTGGVNLSGRIGFTGFSADIDNFGMWVSSATSATTLASYSTNPIAFRVNNSEQMRLTSTGLGIGTSSPAYKLAVNGNAGFADRIVFTADQSTYGTFSIGRISNTLQFQGGSSGYVWRNSGDTTNLLKLDDSGNLGLGVTPSASWVSSQGPAFQVGLYTSVFNNGYLGAAEFAYNTVRNGNDTYVYGNTGVSASRLQQRDGQFKFFTAPSGTAGDAISFTQAMTLDASGNLLLGTTSGSGAFSRTLDIQGSGSAGINLTCGGAYSGAGINVDASANLVFRNVGAERARITSAGNVLFSTTDSAIYDTNAGADVSAFYKFIATGGGGATNYGFTVSNSSGDTAMGLWGVNSASKRLRIASVLSQYTSSTAGSEASVMTFSTMGSGILSERARIDSSGNLLVGNASAPQISSGSTGIISGIASSASGTAIAASLPASATGNAIRAQSVTSAGTGWNYFVGSSGNGSTLTTNNIFIYGNGNIQNTNNSYGAISDVKLKENIVDATPKLADLMQVRVRSYNLKGDYESHKQIGVIAQELETVFPGMIEETADKDMEGNDLGTTTKSVKYSVFVPMLIKAIQELKAEFDAYKASHP